MDSNKGLIWIWAKGPEFQTICQPKCREYTVTQHGEKSVSMKKSQSACRQVSQHGDKSVSMDKSQSAWRQVSQRGEKSVSTETSQSAWRKDNVHHYAQIKGRG